MAKDYTINGEEFNTQKSLEDRIKGILHGPPNLPAPLGQDDFNFIFSLISDYHGRPDIKIGPGVKEIGVRKNQIYKKNREFYLLRVDGSLTDVSYKECLSNRSPEAKFRTALRKAVSPQIIEFKMAFWEGKQTAVCPLTGETIAPGSSHIDHEDPSFEEIVIQFIQYLEDNLGITSIEEIKLTGARDGEIGEAFENPEIEEEFLNFHKARARLRVTSERGNLSGPRVTKPEQLSLL